MIVPTAMVQMYLFCAYTPILRRRSVEGLRYTAAMHVSIMGWTATRYET